MDGHAVSVHARVESNREALGQVENGSTLRELTRTAPYMHDGSLATLEEVVDFYDRGGEPNPDLDPLIRPLRLTESERMALLAFLDALTGSH